MPSHRRLASIPITVACDGNTWEYKPLAEIQILEGVHGRFARLICEHDCGGQMFTAHCSERNFVYLEPYAQQLQTNKEDPFGIENPVIPIFFNSSGRAFLSINGARTDHPELPRPRKQLRRLPHRAPEPATNQAASALSWLQNLFRP